MGKLFEQHTTKEDVQEAIKHIRRYLKVLYARDMKISNHNTNEALSEKIK